MNAIISSDAFITGKFTSMFNRRGQDGKAHRNG
uniref:Uncharacterized protein n=1 Tax=Anguilla anguilla TaxID=7936 RepID=A0A0E9R5Y4_ANGAN